MKKTATVECPTAPDAGPAYGWLPFSHLNLRRNPFGELTQSERMELAVVDTTRYRRWLDRAKRAVQFIAPCGFGKSTYLLALMRDLQLQSESYIYLPERAWHQPYRSPHWSPSSPLILDEAQRLPRLHRRRIFARYQTLLLGTHRDLCRDLKAVGFEVETIFIDQADATLIATIINRRIEAARLARGPLPSCQHDDARRLLRRFGGNLRAIESHLFDRFQQHAGARDGEVRFID